jgi:predicted short-subunit dehydrogenase-like oxidoreductase (DUF2520 family)
MRTQRINFIGAGKVGKTFGRLFCRDLSNKVTIQAVCNTSMDGARAAVDFIGSGVAFDDPEQCPAADINWILTPDDAIASCLQQLLQGAAIAPGSVVVHSSGCLSSEVLLPARARGAVLLSVHPMKSFANPKDSVPTFAGTFCAFEGDALARERIEPLLSALGAVLLPIQSEHKAVYHAAGVFASNYVVTLLQQAVDCLQYAGIDPVSAKAVVTQLAHGTVANVSLATKPLAALTGPVARGDQRTIECHLGALTPLGLSGSYRCGVEDTQRALQRHEGALGDEEMLSHAAQIHQQER